MQKKLAAIILPISLSLQYALIAYAVDTSSIADSKFSSMKADDVPSLILGTVITILRIAGIVVFTSGVYKMITAKKSGEAEDMNAAMIKLSIGACFLAFPAITKALGLITGG